MRPNFILAAAVLSLLVVSCSKSANEETVLSNNAANATEVINASVTSNGLYELPLNAEEGTVSIHQQATYFTLSSITKDSKSKMMVYKYIPAEGFSGSDEVVLSKTYTYQYTAAKKDCRDDESMLVRNVTNTTYITIRFKVSPAS